MVRLALLLCCCCCCSALQLQRARLLRAAGDRHPTGRAADELLMLAKKKGGSKKKGGKQKKESGFAWAQAFELKPFESSDLRALAETVVSTHQAKTGKPLHKWLVGATDVPKKLWSAPVAVMVVAEAAAAAPDGSATPEGGAALDGGAAPEAGDVEAEEPSAPVAVCKYANLAALETYGFGDDFQKLIGQPAELASSAADKYSGDYTKKLRGGAEELTVQGARFVLEKAAVVGGKLVMESLGVAYCWSEWMLEDGTVCSPGGQRRAPELTPEQVAASIEAQGAEVRRLKDSGLGNKDAEVMAAVAELLRLKELLPAEETA